MEWCSRPGLIYLLLLFFSIIYLLAAMLIAVFGSPHMWVLHFGNPICSWMAGIVSLKTSIWSSCDWQQMDLRRKENLRGPLGNQSLYPRTNREYFAGHSHFSALFARFWSTVTTDIRKGGTLQWANWTQLLVFLPMWKAGFSSHHLNLPNSDQGLLLKVRSFFLS